ncbi:MAG: MarR family winged helix-turn-helix transcriptional regulator [Bdellovibrionota bacterium]
MSINNLMEAYRSFKREITLIASTELKKVSLGEKQMVILFYLAENQEATASCLASHTKTDPASVTRALQSLEGAGFIRKKMDPEDNRRSHLEITAKGRAKAESLEVIRNDISERIKNTLTAREIKELERLMRVVGAGLAEQRA